MKKLIKSISSIKITNNVLLIALSIFVSIIAWLAIMDYENPAIKKTFTRVPIVYNGLETMEARDLFIESELASSIDITVNGKRKNIISLDAEDFLVSVDLRSVSAGELNLPIEVKALKNNVNILSTSVDSVAMSLDDIEEKDYPIGLVSDGEINQPMYVKQVTTTPQSIVIRGPSKTLIKINKVFAIYPLNGADKSFVHNSELTIVDADGQALNNLTLDQSSIDVSVTVGSVKDVMIVEDVNPLLDDTLKIMSFDLSEQKATIKGSVEFVKLINQLKTNKIIAENKKGIQTLDVTLDIPKNIELVKPHKLMATLDVDQYEEKNFTLTKEQIALTNLNDSYVAIINDDILVDVKLTGLSRDLAKLKTDYITLNIDLDGYETGYHDVPFTLDIPDGLTYEANEDLVVQVMLEEINVGQ